MIGTSASAPTQGPERMCSRCGERVTDAAHGLCEPCVRERALAERADQGLPPTVQDPGLLAQIAPVVRHALASAAPTSAGAAPRRPGAGTTAAVAPTAGATRPSAGAVAPEAAPASTDGGQPGGPTRPAA